MRKLRRTFVDVVNNGEAAWSQSQGADTPRRKTVAEDILLRYMVGWESFASEWFIAAVNHDAARLRRSIERRMDSWLQREVAASPYARLSPNFVAPTLPLARHPRVQDVRGILDVHERNIEFANVEALADRAHRELAPRYAARVQAVVDSGAAEIIDAGGAIRNVLAHRSRQAITIMNSMVASFPTYPALRKATMSSDGIGTYLVARTAGGEARLSVFQRELERIALILVP